jgi:hypothetical protein
VDVGVPSPVSGQKEMIVEICSNKQFSFLLVSCLHLCFAISSRLDIKTMFKIRDWERFKFLIHHENKQEYPPSVDLFPVPAMCHMGIVQQKDILSRNIPDNLKLSIAKRIEGGLFGKVCPPIIEISVSS